MHLAAWLSSPPGPLPGTAKGTGAAEPGTGSLRETCGCPTPLLGYPRPIHREVEPAARSISVLPVSGGTQVGVEGLFPENDLASDGALGIRPLAKSLPGLHPFRQRRASSSRYGPWGLGYSRAPLLCDLGQAAPPSGPHVCICNRELITGPPRSAHSQLLSSPSLSSQRKGGRRPDAVAGWHWGAPVTSAPLPTPCMSCL